MTAPVSAEVPAAGPVPSADDATTTAPAGADAPAAPEHGAAAKTVGVFAAAPFVVLDTPDAPVCVDGVCAPEV
ncbi:hypothetical protein [Luteimicrobium subarcticum]|uniref:Uncharacterized protein n=1 Tax=Luteimicrobium subarcticum TaxID=620910 RepID=A0A2M8WIZ9_9MICO|nr:hypothetical protein [Luteimicrobium subarcticum]PJI90905.1 hypothetical protein CLV34_2161 [Luteimicrobium subarcticum]